VQCDLEVRLGKTSAALKACNKAIAIWDGSMWAHYLAGSIAARGKRHSAAVKHLKRAIELDPEMQSLWSLLGKVYEKAGKTDELDALRAKYKQEFGKPL
jgi:predicted Zn-dependent protease